MRIEKADVVVPLNGRDAGKSFIVIDLEDDSYALLADGKGRRAEKPKRKKYKHVRVEGKADDPVAAKLCKGEKVTNSEIRRALSSLADRREKGGM